VADFFLHLFEVEKRSPVTIEGYRSAINTAWNAMGRSLLDSFHLGQLLKNFKAERPRSVHRVPKWDLNLVLRALSKPPFHPIATSVPALLSQKTVFLLLLASARRRGEIHAIDPNRVTFTRTGVVLVPHPGFLPKVISTAEGEARYAPIVIKNLDAVTIDPDELSLCPVRALQAYDRYARARNPDRDRFFISTRSGANPVVKATISSWVVRLLRRAHENVSEEDTALSSCSTHEIRALAASLAVQATFSLSDVLSAASWATPTTFATYYMRDVSGVQSGLHVIGPCVIAGTTFR
jgi:integrase